MGPFRLLGVNFTGGAVLCLVAQSCLTLCDRMDYSPPGSSVHGDSPGKSTGVDCHTLLQRIFPTKGSNPGLPHCRWTLYCLSHQGNPRILGLVAYPFSRGSSGPRNWTRVSCIAGEFFTSWATREAPKKPSLSYCFYSCGKFSAILQLSFWPLLLQPHQTVIFH